MGKEADDGLGTGDAQPSDYEAAEAWLIQEKLHDGVGGFGATMVYWLAQLLASVRRRSEAAQPDKGQVILALEAELQAVRKRFINAELGRRVAEDKLSKLASAEAPFNLSDVKYGTCPPEYLAEVQERRAKTIAVQQERQRREGAQSTDIISDYHRKISPASDGTPARNACVPEKRACGHDWLGPSCSCDMIHKAGKLVAAFPIATPTPCADPGPFNEGCQRPNGHAGDHTHWHPTSGGSGSWANRIPMARKQPLKWRVQDDGAKGFDELVVGIGGKPCLIHAEMMSKDSIFVTVGHLAIWAHVDKQGNAEVVETEWRGPASQAPGVDGEKK